LTAGIQHARRVFGNLLSIFLEQKVNIRSKFSSNLPAMKNTQILAAFAALTATALLPGCTAGPGETSGTAIGAGTGAIAGAIIGNNVRGVSSGEGAVAGALLGGVVGNRIGAQQDQINQLKYEQRYGRRYYDDRYYAPPPPPPGYHY
jgi:hypothetical protein